MVDARGYSCPTPVIMVQKAVKNGSPKALEVAVDNQCSVENVTRFARNAGYAVEVSDLDGDFLLKLTK
ncbi:MAG: sulfurtransferase TusA family protein [Oscillospiraceae bacterium]|nr:sulfurtransferase TusA family protein [Oscillospiraceae bacterium]